MLMGTKKKNVESLKSLKLAVMCKHNPPSEVGGMTDTIVESRMAYEEFLAGMKGQVSNLHNNCTPAHLHTRTQRPDISCHDMHNRLP